VRKTAAIVLASAFIITAAGCAAIPEPAGCTPNATAGDASKAITATGAFGASPAAKIPTPTVTKKVETSTVVEGKGAQLHTGAVANVQTSIYLGATGQLLQATSYAPDQALQVTVGIESNVIGRYLQCQRVGSRSTTVLTAKQYFGAAPDPSTGLTSSDTLVLVTDIQKSFLGRANGPEQPLQSGFPTVVTAPDGTPGVTLSLQSPPKDLRYELVRRGDGATVKKGDHVLLNYTGIDWTTQEVFKTTWTQFQPEVIAAESIADNAAATLDPGSAKAIIGQTVGSQVLVVVPPKFGYPSGKAPDGYPSNSTMVFVYDILGIE
jgi:peptidylprolyl isomerase